MKQTQGDRILAYLRKHGSATYGELIRNGGGNWPHKRIDEFTDAGGSGNVYERRGNGWASTGERIVREKRRFRGRDLTVVRLVRRLTWTNLPNDKKKC